MRYTASDSVGIDTTYIVVCDSLVCDTTIVYITLTDTSSFAFCKDTTIYLSALGGVTIDSSYVNSNSFSACGISSMSMSKSSFTCSDIGTQNVTLYVTNSSGRVDSCTSQVIVLDTLLPTITCMDTTVYLDAAGKVQWDTSYFQLVLDDNCGVDSVWMSIDSAICSNDTVNVTTYVRDKSKNIDSCTSQVIVLDTLLPTITCMDTTVYLDAAGKVQWDTSYFQLVLDDNCGVDSVWMSIDSAICSNDTVNVTTYVRDKSKNIDSCTSQVIVLDTPITNYHLHGHYCLFRCSRKSTMGYILFPISIR